MRGVGAGDIQFVRGNTLAFVEDANHGFIVLAGVAEDVADHHHVFFLAQQGKLFFHKSAGADVLQADGIQHAGCGLKDAWRRVPGHGFARQAFADEAAQLFQADDVFKLNAITKGAAGGNHRVLELDA